MSTQDKQTDAAGRAGELRLAIHDLAYDLQDTKEWWLEFDKAIDAYVDSATRTAVTEALDKLEAKAVDYYHAGRVVMLDEIDELRAVIAAGGKDTVDWNKVDEYLDRSKP